MMTKEDILRMVKENNIELIRFLYTDNDGVIRGYVATAEALEGDLDTGHQFAVAMPFFSALDTLVPDSQFGCAGELSGVPDFDTFRILPYVPDTAMLICDFKHKADHTPSELCARSTLKRLLDSVDYEIACSFENEFYLLERDETGNIIPFHPSLCFATSGMNTAHPIMVDIIRALKNQNVMVEKYYPEYGGAQYEVVYRYSDALRAADNQVIFRETVRGVAQNHGLTATFMPKPFADAAGSGAHVHISLWKDGKNLFYDEKGAYGLSERARHFIGGILQHLKAICAFTAPIVTSYKRLLPHHWASAFGCYGPDNREAAIRIVTGLKGKEASIFHLEFKPIDGTCNPYLALTAILAAGFEGIKNHVDPGKAVAFDPADLREDEREKMGIFRLPESLGEAIEALKADSFFKSVMGAVLYDEYIKLKRFDWLAYIDHVSQWEIDRYVDAF
jgi:glutamine synthetase